MSLRLDNATNKEVKIVTNYRIINISISAISDDVVIVYQEYSDNELIGTNSLVVNNPVVFNSLKTQAYNFLKNNLNVDGTVN